MSLTAFAVLPNFEAELAAVPNDEIPLAAPDKPAVISEIPAFGKAAIVPDTRSPAVFHPFPRDALDLCAALTRLLYDLL